MSLSPFLAESPDDLASVRTEWDELAVRSGRPFSAPAWPMAWWEHMRPEDAMLRVIVVREGEHLAGVIPLFASGGSLALVGSDLAPVEPLARPGLEGDVAVAAAGVLVDRQAATSMINLQLHGTSPDWGNLLARGWPGGRVWRWVKSETPLPRVDLGENGFEAWLSAKSGSFRRDVRRNRRALEKQGGTFRFTTTDSLREDVDEFLKLHRRRLAGRGGTDLAREQVEHVLMAAAKDLLPMNRFRLLCLEMDGKVISSQLLLTAGREVSAWNSGFDEAYAQYSPSMQCIIFSLQDASERGERTMSLGPGGQGYKYRIATEEDCLRYQVLVPFGGRYPFVRLRLLPQQARRTIARRLPAQVKRRLRRSSRR